MPTSSPRTPKAPTSYAVLGLLSVRTWTTYELAKQVQRSLNWFWPRAERRLYDEPKQLVAHGLATATKEFTGQRPRTVYGITDAGRAALRDWLGQPSSPRAVESEAMLKVFFSDAGNLDQLTATLEGMVSEAQERLSQLADLAGSAEHQPAFPHRLHISALALRLHLDQELTTLRWARWAQEQVALWRDTTDPGSWDHLAQHRELVRLAHEALRAERAPTVAG